MKMASLKIVGVVAAALVNGAVAASLRSRPSQESLESYSFTQFVQDFGRSYIFGSSEYAHRSGVFRLSLLEIHAANAKVGRTWTAGFHKFMDYTVEERHRLLGYKPSRAHARAGGVHIIALQTDARLRMNATELGTSGGMAMSDGPAIRDQGDCGSCWAISSVEAVEAQLANGQQLSAQALVDCVPNPQHCGGSGGCDGATGELAYAFVRDYGIPLEKDLPYTAQTQQCPENPLKGAYPAMTRVRASGWNALPSNQAKPLMQALVSQGPAVVAVDGNNWFDYEKGVFDSCDKDAIIGHAVLATGFGQDNGNNYWQIQNSWGQQWGEEGHIRLLKRDDDDTWCGTDRKPKEGLGCDGGPSEVKVCGTCGVLFDSLVPQGVRMESQ